jgi:hypothetical protein
MFSIKRFKEMNKPYLLNEKLLNQFKSNFFLNGKYFLNNIFKEALLILKSV